MKIAKLIKMGRVKPIYNKEKTQIIGYERSKDSRKSHQKYMLKKPQKVVNAETKLAEKVATHFENKMLQELVYDKPRDI